MNYSCLLITRIHLMGDILASLKHHLSSELRYRCGWYRNEGVGDWVGCGWVEIEIGECKIKEMVLGDADAVEFTQSF